MRRRSSTAQETGWAPCRLITAWMAPTGPRSPAGACLMLPPTTWLVPTRSAWLCLPPSIRHQPSVCVFTITTAELILTRASAAVAPRSVSTTFSSRRRPRWRVRQSSPVGRRPQRPLMSPRRISTKSPPAILQTPMAPRVSPRDSPSTRPPASFPEPRPCRASIQWLSPQPTAREQAGQR